MSALCLKRALWRISAIANCVVQQQLIWRQYVAEVLDRRRLVDVMDFQKAFDHSFEQNGVVRLFFITDKFFSVLSA